MKVFSPCRGKTACRDDGTTCLTCGRDLQEIEATRRLIDGLAGLAIDQAYENVNDFMAYVAGKVEKKVRHRREGQGGKE